MNKIIVIGDIHLDEQSTEEVVPIICEIASAIKNPSEFWFLGDFFHRKKPTPIEYDIATGILCNLKKIAPIHIITGNHDAITQVVTALDYSKHFGINLYNDKVTMQRNGKAIYLGHHFTDQGDPFRKDERYKVSDLAKNDLALLGHDHCFRKLAENVYHLGSVRRVTFAEVDYDLPKYAILDPQTLEIEFREPKTAIPMYDVNSINEALKMPSKAKIRLVLSSFEQFMKSVDKIPELQGKFEQFAIKHDYQRSQITERKEVKETAKSFEEIFHNYLETVKNKEVRKILEDVWKNEN